MRYRISWLHYVSRWIIRNKIPAIGRKMNYTRRKLTSAEDASVRIAEMLKSGKPFMAGRLGFSETAVLRAYEFQRKSKYAVTIDTLYNWSGFFPNDISYGGRFLEIMTDSLRQTDILGCNSQLLEEYFIDRYLPSTGDAVPTFQVFEPYSLKNAWSSALAGKKVLVVSPFSESVRQQYARREKIFPGTDILPEFTLITFPALMTLGDIQDERFGDWFEALDYMKKEILAIDFDVALLSCGAYGFPLAAEIKKAGRQAIHVGGVLQIYFGILGRRWDGSRFGGIEHMDGRLKRYYNESWIYPIEARPSAADKVEYGPYWK